jgi:hypothetical protein
MNGIRRALKDEFIVFCGVHDDTGIFDQPDAFVKRSRNNQTVEQVVLWIPFIDAGDNVSVSGTNDRYAVWEKIAEGIGNLEALRKIEIVHFVVDGEWDHLGDDEWEALVPDWEILACILRRLRHGIKLCMQDDEPLPWDTGALQVLAKFIHGQAVITGFSSGADFPFSCLDSLCSVLLTLPALENVSFEQRDGQPSEEGQSLESLVKLLQSPVLREVAFESVDFTKTLSQLVVANVLTERSEITDLHFLGCSFPEGEDALIANALETNTTLKRLHFDEGCYNLFCRALAAALLSNSVHNLSFASPDESSYNIGSCSLFSPFFLALQANVGLKELSIYKFVLIDEKLSASMRLGLGKTSTLETLNLSSIKSGDDDTYLWREALSFLSTNTALKTLHMSFDHKVTQSHVTAIRMEVLSALRENQSLEKLSLCSDYASNKFEDYLVFVAAIQPNITLKILLLQQGSQFEDDLCLNEDETKRLILLLRKNYGLEEISGLRYTAGDIRSIFQLNRAGRRYLVQDGSSISKGVDVLIGVSNEINSVFLHLLENPRLCDRCAVEMSAA